MCCIRFSQTTCKFVMYKHQNQDLNSKTFLSYQLVCLLEVRYKSFLGLRDLFEQMNLKRLFEGKKKKKGIETHILIIYIAE